MWQLVRQDFVWPIGLRWKWLVHYKMLVWASDGMYIIIEMYFITYIHLFETVSFSKRFNCHEHEFWKSTIKLLCDLDPVFLCDLDLVSLRSLDLVLLRELDLVFFLPGNAFKCLWRNLIQTSTSEFESMEGLHSSSIYVAPCILKLPCTNNMYSVDSFTGGCPILRDKCVVSSEATN